MNPLLIAKALNRSQEQLITTVAGKLDYTSSALRGHLQQSLTKNKFNTNEFLKGKLQTPLENLMIAGHVAGAKSAIELAKRAGLKEEIELSLELGDELELSILSTAVQFANKLRLNLPFLRRKYKTLAFQVLTDASSDINKELAETLKQLINEGVHVREAKEVLQAKFDQLGIRPASKGQLETIFRTQLQIVFAGGKFQAETTNPYIYRELWGYMYVTTEDSRVRPTHAILDGVTLPKDDPFWDMFYPPNGYNCRCQAIPIFHAMPIVRPPKLYLGRPIAPDKGFGFKAGAVFNALAG